MREKISRYIWYEFGDPKMPWVFAGLIALMIFASIFGTRGTPVPAIEDLISRSGSEVTKVWESKRTRHFIFTDRSLFLKMSEDFALDFTDSSEHYDALVSKLKTGDMAKFVFLTDQHVRHNYLEKIDMNKVFGVIYEGEPIVPVEATLAQHARNHLGFLLIGIIGCPIGLLGLGLSIYIRRSSRRVVEQKGVN